MITLKYPGRLIDYLNLYTNIQMDCQLLSDKVSGAGEPRQQWEAG